MGRGRRFPVLVLAHARQVVQTFLSSGPAEGTPQLAEGHDYHDVVYA